MAVYKTLSLAPVIAAVMCCLTLAKGELNDSSLTDAELDMRHQLIHKITDMTAGSPGLECRTRNSFRTVPVPIQESLFGDLKIKIDLIGQLLGDAFDTRSKNFQELVESIMCRTLNSAPEVQMMRVIVEHGGIKVFSQKKFTYSNFSSGAPSPQPGNNDPLKCEVSKQHQTNKDAPWFKSVAEKTWNASIFQGTEEEEEGESGDLPGSKLLGGHWTYPYFECQKKRWMLSYVKAFGEYGKPPEVGGEGRIFGHVSVDVDISHLDINQCDSDSPLAQNISDSGIIRYFENTHRCPNFSRCVFRPGSGWSYGSYVCECEQRYYSRTEKPFRGYFVEVRWKQRLEKNWSTYDLYVCTACKKGCETCTDDSPCIAEYDMPFRITLLAISVMCIFLTFILMALVYHYRSVKVFKVASPPFLEICLFGCIVMYLEMASIFPVLDMFFCICTKWTRHMGFCITFSSLLMKTWRVSLTYRVKSAHKIKLTDKQLMQWMTPIILIMGIYLGAWTISDPPVGAYLREGSGLLFTQCTYNAWDHVLAIGELIFLLWGVKVCFCVRKAESFFDEAKCISWAVYNITIVNIIMACFHIFILPNAGPDIKYFFGFIRTQLSTTTTIALIFGPKLYRVFKGTGDQLDNRARAKGVTTNFSINGIGGNEDGEPPDPAEENEELKEEIQKLAAQIEFMKIVHMEVNNRHLKPKPGSYFSEKNPVLSSSGQSPSVTKNSLSKMEVSENSSAGANPPADPNPEKV